MIPLIADPQVLCYNKMEFHQDTDHHFNVQNQKVSENSRFSPILLHIHTYQVYIPTRKEDDSAQL